jgi:hypothetical protein
VKSIRAVIPYEEPNDIVSQNLFSRFKPIDKWKDSKNKLEKAKLFALDRTRKNIGSIRLEMHIIHIITYKEANIGDIILS